MIYRREHGKTNVASLVERKTRYSVLLRNNDPNPKHFMNRLMNVVEPLPQTAAKSITFGRGIEFSGWRKPRPGIGPETCHETRQSQHSRIATRRPFAND